MATLVAKSKGLYYPTPKLVYERIAKHLAAPHGGRLLDPCVGDGSPASFLAGLLGIEGYGIELNHERAAIAGRKLKRVVQSDAFSARLPLGTVGLLFHNPPYDYDDETLRLEYKFVRETYEWIQPGGVHVLIVPQPRMSVKMCHYLARGFQSITAYRFPDPEYAIFKQVVVFMVRKPGGLFVDDAAGEALYELCLTELPILPEVTDRVYTLPVPTPAEKFYVRSSNLDSAELLKESMGAGGIGQSNEWFDALDLTPEPPIIPLMPLKMGHLAMTIACGLLQNILLEKYGDNGLLLERVLVKGRTYKTVVVTEIESENGKSSETHKTDKFVTEIVALNLLDGTFRSLSTAYDLSSFIGHWRNELASKVQETYKPLYDFGYAENVPLTNILNSLSTKRHLGGRVGTGLFETQKHVAVALSEMLTRNNYAILQGAMGTGKTTVATAVAAISGAYPALVLCPPHLVKKWKREIEGIIPGAQAIICGRMHEVDAFFKLVDMQHPATPMFCILSREMAKLGSGWRGAYNLTTKIGRDRKEPTKRAAFKTFTCPECGNVVTDSEGRFVNEGWFESSKRKCTAAISFHHEDGTTTKQECGAALWQAEHLNGGVNSPKKKINLRYPISDYINRQYKGRFALCILDEVHQLKGQNTDQGYAMGALIAACQRTLAMTGTIYGGRATSIFYLLHRLDWKLRERYAWADAMRFAEQYGVLERVTRVSREESSNGKFSGKTRTATTVHELAGCSPELSTLLLSSTAFMSLEDIGQVLPPYEDVPVLFDMTDDQADSYKHFEGVLKEDLKQRLRVGDKSTLSKFLQSTLGRPNASWREDDVRHGKTNAKIAYAPAITLPEGEYFPKATWLLELCQSEIKQGRKVLVYCRQTDTRDITENLRAMLVKGGLKVCILKSSVDTQKREEWVEAQSEAGMQVMLCNPKLVETGLDLIEYPTIVFYEVDYNLYTMMQASRRSWRLGQEQAVRVYFLCYRGTMEQRATTLIAKKWASANLLSGDGVEGAIAAQVETDENMMALMAREALEGGELEDLQGLFRRKAEEAKKKPHDEYIGVVLPPAPERVPPPVKIVTFNYAGEERDRPRFGNDRDITVREHVTTKIRNSSDDNGAQLALF